MRSCGWVKRIPLLAALILSQGLQAARCVEAAEITEPQVELGLPGYYPEELRHPDKFFTGRTLQVTTPTPLRADQEIALVRAVDGQKIAVSITVKAPNVFRFVIPVELPTSRYHLSFSCEGKDWVVPIDIHGFTTEELTSLKSAEIAIPMQAFSSTAAAATEDPVITYRTRICDTGYWEMAFAGDPNDPLSLFQFGVGHLARSRDGGRTWNCALIDDVAQYPDSNTRYQADPKMVGLPGGPMLLSSLVSHPSGRKGGLYRVWPSGPVEFSTWEEDGGGSLDYPKLAADPNSSSVYVTSRRFFTFFPYSALYVSQDGGMTFTRHQVNFGTTGMESMTVGADGALYVAISASCGTPIQINRFRSFSPPVAERLAIPNSAYFCAFPRTSPQSGRRWVVWAGPEVVADTGAASPHRGRLYVVWAKEERVVDDPGGEVSRYGENFDIFMSFSDDDGATWSAPARANDDIGSGDQGYPSARVDANGVLHIAFADHRDRQDEAVFDIYYTNTTDGIHVAPNVRVTDVAIANPLGGSSIGDYEDMIMPYPDHVYVAYPCENGTFGPTGACMAELDPPINHAPVLVPVNDQSIAEGKRLEFHVVADDADGNLEDPIAARDLPTGAEFIPLGDLDQDGDFDVDDVALASECFETPSTPLSGQCTLADMDGGGTVTIGEVILTEGIRENLKRISRFRWTPPIVQGSGTVSSPTISFAVTDANKLTDSKPVTITVQDVPPPTVTIASPAIGTTVNRTQPVVLAGAAQAGVGDTLEDVTAKAVDVTNGAAVHLGFLQGSVNLAVSPATWLFNLPSTVGAGRYVKVTVLATSASGQIGSAALQLSPTGQVSSATCHLLTAAFGRADHPVIQTLWAAHHRLVGRQWDAPWHQAYLAWYDRVGPRVAGWVRERAWRRSIIRSMSEELARGAKWWQKE